MIRIKCPACNSGATFFSFKKDGYAILQCTICGTMFVKNIPSAEVLSDIYNNSGYYDLEKEPAERIRREARRRLKILNRWKSNCTYFEIGCARGLQLDVAQKKGFTTYGIELSKENVMICQDKGHRVICGYLEDALDMKPMEGFQVISCLDVIEHVPDPISFLKLATSMLSEDGVFILSTPNYSGIIAKVLKKKDPYMTPPEHLNFFSLQGIRNLCKQVGLRMMLRTTFGSLTSDEKERVVGKYLPAQLHPFAEPLIPLLPGAMKILNVLKIGMEQEFYLVKNQ